MDKRPRDASPSRAALAEDGAVDQVQAHCACLPLPPRSGVTVPCQQSPACLRHRRTTVYLCSVSSQALVIPSTRLNTVDDRAFYVAETRTWNCLSDFVTSASSNGNYRDCTMREKLPVSLTIRSFGFPTLHVRLFVSDFCFFAKSPSSLLILCQSHSIAN